jgi:hypothetical protein
MNSFEWNYNLFLNYLNRDDWDCISFNRKINYDIRGLIFDKYYNIFDFGDNSDKINNHIKDKLIQKLNNIDNNELLECLSVFNGFAIYRTKKFIYCYYDGYQKNLNDFIDNKKINLMIKTLKNELNDDTIQIFNSKIEIYEHVCYHLNAIKKNNARIRISKEYIDFYK